MKSMLKKYVPYAIILAALYMLLPLMFISGDKVKTFTPIVYDFIFPGVAVITAVHYSWKNGLDFLFAVIAPVMYLPSMLIYENNNGIIFLVIYLVCGILGSFIGDMVFIDEKKKKEKEKKELKKIAVQIDTEKKSDSEDVSLLIEKENFNAKHKNNDTFTPVSDDAVSESEIDKILNENKYNK